ncbi:hypothetical protein B0A55_01719 [Friedmanniomyces simplex]|uniref:Major facilitator superfamily (MFS) profile domain-containing protein n=1 Tax=Friedmanniomyces simplex TaxID=329884 RepID=A0A4U0Y0Y6_9PEZI|nr:hypothetical protein B0A55_01719 [Friedmanniomyces simplex]
MARSSVFTSSALSCYSVLRRMATTALAMMNGLQTLGYWQNHFHHPSAATLGLLNAIFSVGQVVGLPFVPLLADGIGRKWTILLGSSLIFLGVILQTVSTTIGMFIAARFIIGLGICYTQSCSPMLITELSHPQYRARYQIVKDKHDLARKTFERFHAPSSGQAFVEAEYQEVLETMALEKEFGRRGISELWKTPGNRHRFLIALSAGFFSQTAGSGIVSYYIFLVLQQIGITDSKDQLVLNGRDLHIPAARQQWIVSAYSLAFGCFLMLWGRLADVYGKRLVFILGSAWVCIVTLVCPFIPHEIGFDIFRGLQGLGAAVNAVMRFETTIRFLLTGVCGVLTIFITSQILARVRVNYILMFGTFCVTISSLLFAVPIHDSETYWAYGFC